MPPPPPPPATADTNIVVMPAGTTNVPAEVNTACRGPPPPALAAVCTKAVVASWVVLTPGAAVGAVGVPVKAGDNNFANSDASDPPSDSAFIAVVAVPVIVPAEKFPLASLRTIILAVFVDTAPWTAPATSAI